MIPISVSTNSYLVTAKITATPAAGLEFTFQNIPEISKNNIEVYAIEAVTASQLAKSRDGSTVIAAAGALNVTVSIIDSENRTVLQDYPYYNLVRANTGGLFFLTDFWKVNLTECKIRLNAATSLNVNEVAVFILHYRFI
jgi:hypothetical protein